MRRRNVNKDLGQKEISILNKNLSSNIIPTVSGEKSSYLPKSYVTMLRILEVLLFTDAWAKNQTQKQF